jgi:hypothetical protein
MITFLPAEEPDASHASAALADALVGIARRRSRIAMLTTIDGLPALESPLAKVLAEVGFAPRQGALVFLPARGRGIAVEGRRGALVRAHAGRPPVDEAPLDEMPLDDLPPDDDAFDELPPDEGSMEDLEDLRA